jgi:hypothetical protein
MRKNFTLVTTVAILLSVQSLFAADFTVTSTANSGPGSLRQAVRDAEANGTGLDNIFFAIPETLIELTDSITINSPVFIDGYTQPGSQQGAISSGRNLQVALSFNPFTNGNASSTIDGLYINSRGVTIRGLAIVRARVAVTIAAALNANPATGLIRIQGCNIGLSEANQSTVVEPATGIPYLGRNSSHGVSLLGATSGVSSTRVVIGVDGDGTNDANEGNLISNNLGDGIFVNAASYTVIAGNYIGTLATGGQAPFNSTNSTGVNLDGANLGAGSSNNRIGTNGDGVSDNLESNLISSNRVNGVTLQNRANTNIVAGNLIGLTFTAGGTAGNGRTGTITPPAGGPVYTPSFPLEGNGILVLNSRNNIIGVTPTGGVAAQANTIASSFYNGITVYSNVSGSDGSVNNNSIMGNTVGVGPDKGNGRWGVFFGNAATSNIVSNNFIGSNDDGLNDNIEGNTIAFNKADGVGISESVALTVVQNRISRNSMFSNQSAAPGTGYGLGINLLTSLTDGTTPNTSGGNGPNFLTNYPVIISFKVSAADQKVEVIGTSTSGAFIQLYRASSDANQDNALYNEGEAYLFGLSEGGALDEDGNIGTFKFTLNFSDLAGTIAVGQSVVALAHNSENSFGSTSEFSQTQTALILLPVTFVDFRAELLSEKVLVSWSTSFEQNASHFEVERSTNGRDFTKIGVVKAKGNSSILTNYSYTDASPVLGVSYYRLRQVDIDNRFVYTKTVIIRNEARSKAFTVWPNPVLDNVNVTLQSDKNQNLNLRVVDYSGRVVRSQVVNANRGVNQITVNMSSLTRGMYVIQVIGENLNLTEKVIKQ